MTIWKVSPGQRGIVLIFRPEWRRLRYTIRLTFADSTQAITVAEVHSHLIKTINGSTRILDGFGRLSVLELSVGIPYAVSTCMLGALSFRPGGGPQSERLNGEFSTVRFFYRSTIAY
jgi:hypothetical protein